MKNNFKRFLSLAVALVMVFAMFPMSVFAAEEETTETGWYDETATELVIDTVAEYVEFVQLTLQGITFAGQTVKLGADLDMSEIYIFYNDGTERINNRCDGFAGTFDGDGHTITNMRYFDSVGSETSHVGMAPFRNLSGDIINLTIDGVEVNIKENVRFYGLVAATKGTSASNRCEISNVTIKNIKVTMNNNTETDRICDANGFLGNMQYTDVANCHVENAEFVILGNASYATTGFVYNLASTSTVQNSSVKNLNVQVNGTTGYVGGFAGAVGNQSSITDCTVEGFIATLGGVDTDYGVGGFVGTTTGNWGGNSSTFTNCHVTDMNLTVGTVNAGVGGFAGSNYGGGVNKYIDCTVSGTITANDGNGTTGVGGFIGDLGGRSNGTVTTTCESCVSNVTVSAGTIPAGGFIGTASASTSTYRTPVGNFTNCTATGDVTSAVSAGGFAGTAKLGAFTGCTATGKAVCENGYAAGLIGLNLDESAVVITDCYPTTEYTGIVEDPVYNLEAVAVIGTTGYPTLSAAVAAANELGTATVTLLKDVTLGEKLTVSGNVTIQGAHTITRGIAGTLFQVNKNATLTLDGGVILDGNNDWIFDSENYYADLEKALSMSEGAKSSYAASEEGGIVATAPMIYIADNSNGAVVVNKATIQNSWASNHNGGALFRVPAGANLTINDGALIQHIRGSVAGQLTGTWTVNGGKITDTHGHNTNGGLVDMRGSAIFVINGGEFSYMTAFGPDSGGNGNGILAQVHGSTSKLTINGGYFHDNATFAPGNGWGALVYLNGGLNFEMNGGIIEDTASRTSTAFVSKNSACNIVLNAGTMEINKPTGNFYAAQFTGAVTVGEEMVINCEDGTPVRIYANMVNDGLISGGILHLYTSDFENNSIISSDIRVRQQLAISKGTWLGDITVDEGVELTITGGWYSQDVNEYCAPGYCAVIDYNEELSKEMWHVVPAVAYNVEKDLCYADLSYALSVAEENQTVQLLRETYEELVLVPAGVTFDLNGNVVETENTLSFGVVMDGKENVGGIKIDIDTTKAFTKLQPENGGYLPIYDTRDGMYKFFAFDVQSNAVTGSSSSVIFYNRVVFDNVAGYEVLANTTNSGVDFVLTMDWTGMSGFEIRYYMTEANLKQYAQSAYDKLIGGSANNKAMTATVQGINVLGSGAYISAAPSIETIAEVTDSADALVYKIP